jgi:hypothetical protein
MLVAEWTSIGLSWHSITVAQASQISWVCVMQFRWLGAHKYSGCTDTML